jgi:predicted AAA+ superfamily ATPase
LLFKSIGITDNQIIFINLELDGRNNLLTHEGLHEYINQRICEEEWTYLFIDEVQECNEYEKAIASIYLHKNVDIYITGSNAYMFSGELATKLAGRYIKIDMLPLSFSEYITAAGKSDKRQSFKDFMNLGAFPFAVQLVDDSLSHSQYLSGIYDTVLVKDVLTRNNIRDTVVIEAITKFLCSNIGSSVSAKKIADTLESNRRPIGVATVENYLHALTDAYLFYKVNRYDIKGKMNLKTECKYYICDTGLRNNILNVENRDIGHQLENIVYLELRRRGYTVDIGKIERMEIDFIVQGKRRIEYYQVAASVLDEATLERELASLRSIKDNYPKYLITLDDFTVDHYGIKQINIIDWLLD